jgi:hypothetical protein
MPRTDTSLDERRLINVRFAPLSGLKCYIPPRPRSANSGCEQSQQKKLLDHLVGGDKQPRWHGQAERTLGDWSSN